MRFPAHAVARRSHLRERETASAGSRIMLAESECASIVSVAPFKARVTAIRAAAAAAAAAAINSLAWERRKIDENNIMRS